MSSDPNRARPRSSKKRRAIQQGANLPARPTTRPVEAGRPRPRPTAQRTGSGIPAGWLAAVAIAVVAVGLSFATGAVKLGGGSPSTQVPAQSVSTNPTSSAGGIAGCPTAQPAPAPAGSKPVVTIDTDKGRIELALEADLSPIAVGNFVALASCGYYDGVVFHRIVPGFVIQGGDGQYGRTETYAGGRAGTGGPGYEIQDEPVTTTYKRGTVAMARTSQPNSVGSQFFIVLTDEARADLEAANTYQILGAVSAGMDVVDAIAAAADAQNPRQPVVMTKVTVKP